MTKISMACLAGMLFFASCENENSSTVGTYEQQDSASTDKEENTSKEKNVNSGAENVREAAMDSSKNITGISKDSTVSPNKKDTGTLADKKNVKVQKTKKI